MVYMFLADGFEEIEALTTVDILRRCEVEVQMLSMTGRRVVVGSHGITVKADSLFRKNHIKEPTALIIPGGMKGALTLRTNVVLRHLIAQFFEAGCIIGTICAGPLVLTGTHILDRQHLTCYPSIQTKLGDVIYHNDSYVVECGNLITGAGPAASPYFALTLARRLASPDVLKTVEKDMLFDMEYKITERVKTYTPERSHYVYVPQDFQVQ